MLSILDEGLHMQKTITAAGVLVLVCATLLPSLVLAQPAFAAAQATSISIGPTPPPSSAPDLLVTTFASTAATSPIDYLEIYNQSDTPINLHGWSFQLTIDGKAAGSCTPFISATTFPDGWILSKKYLTFQRTVNVQATSPTIAFTIDTVALNACPAAKLTGLSLIMPDGSVEQSVPIALAPPAVADTTNTVQQHKQRNNSPNSTRTVTGLLLTDDYKPITGNVTLNSDPLYMPPADAAGLQILEILPNARSCSPLETDLTCSDYVKLYNPTDLPIDLARYRLRIGAKGQSESVTNAFTWGSDLDPAHDELLLPAHQYFMLTNRNDGQPLSITDSGNYVWLEDAYGTTIYEPIVSYPDASSSTKVGQAWAYNGTTWQWTSAPQPNASNYFPPAVLSDSTSISTVSVLKPCADNQYRNPDTNRCNSITTAAATLTPCDPNEERSPDTNRCRSIVAAAALPTPCPARSERNPDTNRCRKVAATAVANAVKDIAAPTVDNNGWFIAALVMGLAVAYGIYEWRQDINLLAHKARDRLAALPKQFRH